MNRFIQPKLTIGQPGDKYEQEADRVAHQVVQQINSSLQAKPQDEDKLQARLDNPFIQRQPINISPLNQPASTMQRSGIGNGEMASADFETQIQRARGSGQSLNENIRLPMEQAMGADFSRVKIHADAESDVLSRSIHAKAFTTGQDVFFKQGAYEPRSRGGQELLAHELTHVVQQNGGTVQRSSLPPLQQQSIVKSTTDPTSLLTAQRPLIQRDESSESEKAPDTKNVQTSKSVFLKDTTFNPGEGAIAAISKSNSGTGGHAWAAYEYLSSTGEIKGAVMHLTARGGKGDSASGGSGGSGHHSGSGGGSLDSGDGSGSNGLGDLSGSNVKKGKRVGSFESAGVSNEDDSGSMTYSRSTNTNVGSAEPETFKGSITININENADPGYLANMANKPNQAYKITEPKAKKALAKAQKMHSMAARHKYVYAISGRSISFTKTGMNCARFAEQVLNAAGVNVSAGWIIKTPRELGTGKKIFQ